MRIGEIWRYPVKSTAGEQLPEAELTPLGIPRDRVLYVLDAHGEIVSARTRPRLLAHKATVTCDGEVLVDGLQWDDPRVRGAVERAAGRGATLVAATGAERFDILPLLIATDGAIAAFGYDHRRLRPNVVITGVSGLRERAWERKRLRLPHATIAIADLRGRCITRCRGSAQHPRAIRGKDRAERVALPTRTDRGRTARQARTTCRYPRAAYRPIRLDPLSGETEQRLPYPRVAGLVSVLAGCTAEDESRCLGLLSQRAAIFGAIWFAISSSCCCSSWSGQR